MISFSLIVISLASVGTTALLLLYGAWRVKTGRAKMIEKPTAGIGVSLLSCAFFTSLAIISIIGMSRGIDTGILVFPRGVQISISNTLIFWCIFSLYFFLSVLMLMGATGNFFHRWTLRNGR
ncbi:hypothetical protein [Lysobacter hankyongensis]|uniref:hypothetical protein n=1 Tax=Lysobacter hankyongensis TaxID=1176535 RepID=UPI0031EEE829